MSFFSVKSISSGFSTWEFVGLDNFKALLATSFPGAMKMIFKVWLSCGLVIFVMALFFSVMLTSGIKLKGFFRSMLYLPNVIPQIAIGYMWTLYVFSSRFGLLKKLFTALGWTAMAEFGWTSPDNMFLSMCIAYIFSNVGYFVLMYMSAIESIPKSLYEAATIDGAKPKIQFWKITFPLMRNTIISSITIWTTRVCSFFALSRVFAAAETVSPLMYIYNVVFGSESGRTDVGTGAAAAVILTLVVVVVFSLSNLIPKNYDVEL
jgi:ABC-type sugar transport system permease subunit